MADFEERLAQAWPVENWSDVTVLAAVSGGADSVALLRGLHQLRESSPGAGRLMVAHFNHRLRSDADQDEAFVRELAAKLGLPYETAQADSQAFDLRDGLESAARNARYEFLQATAERLGARFVATAHTADDQVETILHHVVRGTGLAGLAGMPRTRLLGQAVTLIRPLLGIRRLEVEAYLARLGQEFRTDPTNQSPDHTRNRIRHELLPLLEERFHPAVRANLLRLGATAEEAQAVLAAAAAELLERCIQQTAANVRVNCSLLADQPRYLVREMFCALWRQRNWPRQEMTFAHWDSLATFTQPGIAASYRRYPGYLFARREGEWLEIVERM